MKSYLKLGIIVILIPWLIFCGNKTVNNKLIGVKIYKLYESAESVINQFFFMLYRSPEWIDSLVNDFANQGVTSILPSIQVKECYRTEKLELEEFKKCLTESLKAPSKGVIFWSWDYIKQEPDKLEAIKLFLKKYN